MNTSELVELAEHALLLGAILSLPVLAIAALVGLVVAALQTATGLHDSSVSHLGRFLGVSAALLLTGAWLGRSLLSFTVRAFGYG